MMGSLASSKLATTDTFFTSESSLFFKLTLILNHSPINAGPLVTTTISTFGSLWLMFTQASDKGKSSKSTSFSFPSTSSPVVSVVTKMKWEKYGLKKIKSCLLANVLRFDGMKRALKD